MSKSIPVFIFLKNRLIDNIVRAIIKSFLSLILSEARLIQTEAIRAIEVMFTAFSIS